MLADAVELVKTMKRTALDAVNASKPMEVCFGKVVSSIPLKILVEQKMMLGEAQLILTRNVTEYKIFVRKDKDEIQNFNEAEILPEVSTDSASSFDSAVNKIPITISNGLVVGEEVILFRQQGGQKYVVVDRIG